ncbi:MAG: ADP-ribosylglycohydrolase family protein, partial [Bacteroidales bacterium]|nr:ADP-ribosylglycohydrolase family protein [Bacteroidales bacterium]
MATMVSMDAKSVKMSKETLMDKIKGGWAGQTIGCTFGGPTEFKYQGTMIADSISIKWPDHYIKWYFENSPGLYDDVYMDLTFVDVFAKEGLDAPIESFAKALAYAKYPLWHANLEAR